MAEDNARRSLGNSMRSIITWGRARANHISNIRINYTFTVQNICTTKNIIPAVLLLVFLVMAFIIYALPLQHTEINTENESDQNKNVNEKLSFLYKFTDRDKDERLAINLNSEFLFDVTTRTLYCIIASVLLLLALICVTGISCFQINCEENREERVHYTNNEVIITTSNGSNEILT